MASSSRTRPGRVVGRRTYSFVRGSRQHLRRALIREREPVFVDTGAWLALALTRDPYHSRARDLWDELEGWGARLETSVAIVLETFTFLDRNTSREVALAWKDSLGEVPRLRI